MNIKRWVIILFCFVPVVLFAQKSTNPGTSTTENYIRINYDNDFFTATDRYYTQGFRIEYIHSFLSRSPLSKPLLRLGKQSVNYYGIGIEQNVYTPKSITDTTLTNERPYSSTLSLSNFLVSLDADRKLRLTTQLDLGIMGPAAGGEYVQKSIHRLLSDYNAQPVGWENQIKNDAIVNYNTQLEKGIINTKYFELISSGKLRVGTLYNDLSLGTMFRVGLLHPYFETLGLYKNADSKKNINNFQIYLYTAGRVSAIGYDATLQGGLFSNSPYTLSGSNINRITSGVNIGVVFSYKHLMMEFGHSYNSAQFKNGLSNNWGHCNLTIAF